MTVQYMCDVLEKIGHTAAKLVLMNYLNRLQPIMNSEQYEFHL